MPELLAACLDRLEVDLRAARQVLLFSDFDGTLVPISDRPEDAVLDPQVARTLSMLAKTDKVSLSIVSGRQLKDLRTRVGLGEIAYAGNHGLEIEGSGMSFRAPSAFMSGEIEQLIGELAPSVAEIPGAWIENKGLSASVHYRQSRRADVPRLLDAVRQIAAPLLDAGRAILRNGKMVLEIRPAADWNKGHAVRWLADRMSSPESPPALIYLGDDETDEDAFAALRGETTVCVGENPGTAANYAVRDPEQVHFFLNWMLRVMRKPPDGTPVCWSS